MSRMQKALDALLADLLLGAERLREERHAQLLEEPAHVGVRRAPLFEGVDARLQLLVAARVARRRLEAEQDRLQVALDVGEPAGTGGGDEAGMRQATELRVHVLE